MRHFSESCLCIALLVSRSLNPVPRFWFCFCLWSSVYALPNRLLVFQFWFMPTVLNCLPVCHFLDTVIIFCTFICLHHQSLTLSKWECLKENAFYFFSSLELLFLWHKLRIKCLRERRKLWLLNLFKFLHWFNLVFILIPCIIRLSVKLHSAVCWGTRSEVHISSSTHTHTHTGSDMPLYSHNKLQS